jgi:uncharacterized protein DUF3667
MSEAEPETKRCLNCGEPVSGNFCSACGQESHTVLVPVGELLRDVADELFKLDSRLFRTLRALLFRPGFLTSEYVQGRRVRYIAPFKLYFTLVALYLIFHSLFMLARPSAQPAGERLAGVYAMMVSTVVGPERAERVNPGLARVAHTIADKQDLIELLLIPVAALVLKLFYLGSRRLYVEHLVFCVHVSAFWFLLVILRDFAALLIPWIGVLELALLLAYLVLALRAVYQSSLWLCLGIVAVLSAGYLFFVVSFALIPPLIAMIVALAGR